jgi:hypothetical protein
MLYVHSPSMSQDNVTWSACALTMTLVNPLSDFSLAGYYPKSRNACEYARLSAGQSPNNFEFQPIALAASVPI